MEGTQGGAAVRVAVAAVAFIVVLVSKAQPKAIHSIAGPFRIVPGIIEHCPAAVDAPVPVPFFCRGIRDRQDLEQWTYSGNFTTRFTWTNNHDVDVNIASWSSRGGWKDNYYIMRVKHYCSAFKMYAPSFYRQVMLAINNTTDYKNCTWPPGTYRVTNLTTKIQFKAVPTFFYGKWRITARLMNNSFKETLGCVRVYGDTVPRV